MLSQITYILYKIDIDSTLKATENIVDCLNMPSKEEAFILKGYAKIKCYYGKKKHHHIK